MNASPHLLRVALQLFLERLGIVVSLSCFQHKCSFCPPGGMSEENVTGYRLLITTYEMRALADNRAVCVRMRLWCSLNKWVRSACAMPYVIKGRLVLSLQLILKVLSGLLCILPCLLDSLGMVCFCGVEMAIKSVRNTNDAILLCVVDKPTGCTNERPSTRFSQVQAVRASEDAEMILYFCASVAYYLWPLGP